MEKWTKENPGCYHGMIKYLANLHGVSEYIEDKVLTLHDLFHKPDAKKAKHRGLKYNSYNIKVCATNGVTYKYIENGKRFDQKGIIPEYFLCRRLKRIEEFIAKPTLIGKYKDCLGGGWTQSVDLYEVNGKYFALMDCSC
jgi:hypothetical protein